MLKLVIFMSMNEDVVVRKCQTSLELNKLQIKEKFPLVLVPHPPHPPPTPKKSLDAVDLAAGNLSIYLETRSVITRYLRAWAWRGCDPFKREPVTLEVNCPQTVGEWWRINK